jgi:hypothetical protein
MSTPLRQHWNKKIGELPFFLNESFFVAEIVCADNMTALL